MAEATTKYHLNYGTHVYHVNVETGRPATAMEIREDLKRDPGKPLRTKRRTVYPKTHSEFSPENDVLVLTPEQAASDTFAPGRLIPVGAAMALGEGQDIRSIDAILAKSATDIVDIVKDKGFPPDELKNIRDREAADKKRKTVLEFLDGELAEMKGKE